MAHVSNLIAEDIEQYLKSHETKELLRFITCGSVDDGKSTLIGRLLYESKMLFEDQLTALEADSKKMGTQGEQLDFALLVDGLAAEREQGITIDVAYRFFSTDQRKFIVADTPGHEQYTRNMVTGASTADVAILMVDARKGILTQTRRHSYLVSLVGIRHIVVAINKMDLVDYAQSTYQAIVADYRAFAKNIGIENISFIPMSAFKGDNITAASDNMPWYRGTTLMDYLESVEVDTDRMQAAPFRLPVQWVNRPNLDFRGFAGTIASGIIKTGERIRALPSGRESTVTRIVTADGDLSQAVAGQSITLTLADEIDISRGDVLSAINTPASVAKQFEATLVWMNDEALQIGRRYLLKIGANTINVDIGQIHHKVNVNTLEQLAADKLELNEIGICQLSLDKAIAFDPYADNRDTGGFILIDRISNNTIAAGMLNSALQGHIDTQTAVETINQASRAAQKQQKPCLIWLTGLSGAGKSSIACLLEKKLNALNKHTYLLDGDHIRQGLNKDLGFSDTDRTENIRRVAEVSKLMVDAGLIVISAFISPFAAERRLARSLVQKDEFFEIFIDTPLAIAEQRDNKGLYQQARRGELKNFTGIDSAYEVPENPELRIDTTLLNVEQATDLIIRKLEAKGWIG